MANSKFISYFIGYQVYEVGPLHLHWFSVFKTTMYAGGKDIFCRRAEYIHYDAEPYSPRKAWLQTHEKE